MTTEVTIDNFHDVLPLVLDTIQSADFLAFDCEFTGLSADPTLEASLFDTPDQRFKKLRLSAQQLVICQFGLCAFKREPVPLIDFQDDDAMSKRPIGKTATANRFESRCFTFFLCPRSVSDARSKKLLLNTSSLEFLADHGFHFDKWLRSGVPFMNQEEEEQLKSVLHSSDLVAEICNERDDRMDQVFELISQIDAFLSNSAATATATAASSSTDQGQGKEKAAEKSDQDPQPQPPQQQQQQQSQSDSAQILLPFDASINQFRNYAVLCNLRRVFPGSWIRLLNGHLLVKRLTPGDEEQLEARDLAYAEEEEQAIEYMRGFSRVLRTIAQYKKTLVGHNCLTDLIFLYQQMIADLPKHLSSFKRDLAQLFPKIYDTKHMILNMKKMVPELSFIRGSGLKELYDQLSLPDQATAFLYSPVIELMSDENAVGTSASCSVSWPPCHHRQTATRCHRRRVISYHDCHMMLHVTISQTFLLLSLLCLQSLQP